MKLIAILAPAIFALASVASAEQPAASPRSDDALPSPPAAAPCPQAALPSRIPDPEPATLFTPPSTDAMVAQFSLQDTDGDGDLDVVLPPSSNPKAKASPSGVPLWSTDPLFAGPLGIDPSMLRSNTLLRIEQPADEPAPRHDPFFVHDGLFRAGVDSAAIHDGVYRPRRDSFRIVQPVFRHDVAPTGVVDPRFEPQPGKEQSDDTTPYAY